MNATDQRKVCIAGFTILRADNIPQPHIKFKSASNPDHWRGHETGNFSSKSARDRKMKIMLAEDKVIQD